VLKIKRNNECKMPGTVVGPEDLMMLLNVIVIIIIAESQTPYFEDRQ
jgi:hypothetical protein